MGGTFDPIHRGHLRLARAGLARGLEHVDVMPARRPPHKQRPDIAGPFHRFAMAALGTAGQPGMGVSDFEISRDTPSYTIETVRHFTALGHDVTLIMGSDSLADIESWRDYQELLDRARVMVYPRLPATAEDLASHLPAWVRARVQARPSTIEILNEPADTASSSEIRERIRSGRPLEGMVPPAVEEYVRRQGLYVTGAVPGEAGD